ncbi:ELL2 factor, partial [Sagittarius serpentarius]|nr:ELL2 factor [Sagittarius serpentarius]
CAYFSIRKYVTVVSYEQRERYKRDFHAEYDEYRTLHTQIDSITRRFLELDTQWRLLSPESKEHQVKKDKTVKTAFPSSPSY